jgi:hypothetical protein
MQVVDKYAERTASTGIALTAYSQLQAFAAVSSCMRLCHSLASARNCPSVEHNPRSLMLGLKSFRIAWILQVVE